MLAHRVRVAVDGGRDDVDAGRVAVELRRLEVGGERHDVAQVLRRRYDGDPLVLRHGHDVVLDEVLARAEHHVAIGIERLLERRRMVGLDAVDDRRLVDGRVDLPGRGDASGLVVGQLLPADVEDGVGVEAVEGAQAHELVVSLPPQGPLVRPAIQRALQQLRVVGDGLLGAFDRTLEAPALGVCQDPVGGRHDLGQEGRQFAGRLHLEVLPQAHLGHGRARAVLLQEFGQCLEASGDGFQALRQRREIAGKQKEQRVAGDIQGRRATLPCPDDVGVEDRTADVVDLELALQARPRRQPGLVQPLDLREVLLLRPELRQDDVAAAVAQPVVLGVDAEVGRQQRVLVDQAAEAGLDEVVEAIVERPAVGCRRGTGQVDLVVGDRHVVLLEGAARARAMTGVIGQAGVAIEGRAPVSDRASRVAAMVVSMCAAVTP